jgi:hypothetical protein
MSLDDLTRFAIYDFRPFSRLCGGPHSPLRVGKLVRAYQPPALHTNFKYDFSSRRGRYPTGGRG